MEPMLADAHYAMLERLIDGVNYYECSEEEKESIRHLDGIKMCRPRANVQRGLYKIESLGRAALDAYRKDKFYKKIQIINLVISGLAVIIALAAFIKSFFFFGG